MEKEKEKWGEMTAMNKKEMKMALNFMEKYSSILITREVQIK